MAEVVNPYTFVPHVPDPPRGSPSWHHQASDGALHGELTLTITTRTPLMMRGFPVPGSPGETADLPRDAVTGQVILPGSGLAGAIRSVHEALTGSCLRVADPRYVPVHRHAALKSELAGMELGVVAAVDGKGLPTRIACCDDLIQIHQELSRDHPEGPLGTGDVLGLPTGDVETLNGRRVLRPRRRQADGPATGTDPSFITRIGQWDGLSGNGWVLLVTDTAARNKKIRQNRRPAAYFWCGRPGEIQVDVPPDVRGVLAGCLAGSDDLRPANRSKGQSAPGQTGRDGALLRAVTWPGIDDPDSAGPVVGYRLKVSQRLHVGQPVWFRRRRDETGREQVTEVRLSQFWRHRGDIPLGERIGNAGPCTDPSDLCPSCRIFGSAGLDSRDDDAGSRQQSYRGQVRIGDATADGEVPTLRRDRAPLAAPKPSAGQFYLDHTAIPETDRLTSSGESPAYQWGSSLDNGPDGPRQISGRKFYWRTSDPLEGQARGQARSHHSKAMTGDTVTLVDQGATFTARLTFGNLDAGQLGSLVAAIDPRMLWPGQKLVTSLGGGRPFGFGAVSVTVKAARIETTRGRYLGEADQPPPLDGCVAVFAEAQERRPDVRAVWDDLRAALTMDHVPNSDVWYPAGPGVKGSEDFDHAYEFFGKTLGQTVEVPGEMLEDRPLVGLARPHEPASRQRIGPKVSRRPKPGTGGAGSGDAR